MRTKARPSAAMQSPLLAALVGLLVSMAATCPARASEPSAQVSLSAKPGSVAITIGGKPFGTYYYADEAISRPYLANVHAPNGEQVTRNHPAVEGRDLTDHGTLHPGVCMSFGDIDLTDHGTLHPGVCMSFGDINGFDYWRLKAPTKFEKFIAQPAGGTGQGGFKARFSYRKADRPEEVVCREDFGCRIQVTRAGYLLLWDSTFSSEKEFTFGDQEEMGLCFRIATPLRAEHKARGSIPPGNGEIVSSHGAHNEEAIWGNTADWCDYRGQSGDERVGIAILCHPRNFRPSWFHARDYGLLVANPFGRAAFGQGEPSKVMVKPGDALRLRYGVLVHSSPEGQPTDMAAAYKDYIKLAGK